MKKFKSLKNWIMNHKAECAFICYVLPVLLASVLSSALVGGKHGFVLFYTFVIYGVFSLTPKFRSFVQKIELNTPVNISVKKQRKSFFVGFGITAGICLFWFCGYFPGALSPDSVNQLNQVVYGNYNDWHPVLQTLFAFKIPLALFQNVNAIVPFQLLIFTLFMGLYALVSYRLAGSAFAVIAAAVVIASPFTLNFLMFPWKDVSFAMVAAGSFLLTVHLYFEDCKCRVWKLILLAVLVACTTIFRHNGILFSLPLCMALFVILDRKKWVMLIATVFLMQFVVKGPLYSSMNVRYPDQRVVETVGLPLSVIFNVAKECPACLDEQTSSFVAEVVRNQPNWKENHNLGGFNSVKLNAGANLDAIERVGRVGILKMSVECLFKDPIHSLVAIGVLTAIVYGVEKDCGFISIAENNVGLPYNGSKKVRSIAETYSKIVYATPLKWPLGSVGFSIIVMLAFCLFKSNSSKKIYLKRIALCSPIFVYNFGTMLLLTGDDVRFFYISLPIYPLIVLVMARKENDAEGKI